MRSRPLLVAAAAFTIMLISGTALAAVSGEDTAETGTASAKAASGAFAVVAQPGPTVDTLAAPTAASLARATALRAWAMKADLGATEATGDPASVTKVEATSSDGSADSADGSAVTKDPKVESETPLFTIDTPDDGITVTEKMLTFSGTALDGVTVKRGRYVATQDGGTWTMDLMLKPGENKVTFKGFSADGTYSVASVTVFYDAPEGTGDDVVKDGKDGWDGQRHRHWGKDATHRRTGGDTFAGSDRWGTCMKDGDSGIGEGTKDG